MNNYHNSDNETYMYSVTCDLLCVTYFYNLDILPVYNVLHHVGFKHLQLGISVHGVQKLAAYAYVVCFYCLTIQCMNKDFN